MAASAAWDCPTLVDSLARHGWADLAERQGSAGRSVLAALVAVLPHDSGEGKATLPQLARAAGVSTRTIQRGLLHLERLGWIYWVRGYVRGGTPLPSWLRINKTRIGTVIRLIRRAGQTIPRTVGQLVDRMKQARSTNLKAKRKPLDRLPRRDHSHMDTKSSLPSYDEGTSTGNALESQAPHRTHHRTPSVTHHGPPASALCCKVCGYVDGVRHTPAWQTAQGIPIHDWTPRT